MISLTRLLCGAVTPNEALRYGSFQHYRPVVVWNATRRCHLHCRHCYSESQDREYPNELTTTEAERVIADLAHYQVPVLLFSGGEPLLRPDLFELVRQATGQGIRAVLSTNGTLITSAVAQELRAAGVSYVGVSLDGLEATHDRFRGQRGAFREALQGIHSCQEAGLRVGVRFTITRGNYRDLADIFHLVEGEGVPRLCFYHLVYSGRGSRLREEDLSHEETRQAMDLIMEKTRELYGRGQPQEVLTVDNHCDGVYLYLRLLAEEPGRAAEVYRLLQINGGNSSGVGIGCIDNLGQVHADQFWHHYSFGSVRERPFSQIWDDLSDSLMQRLKDKKRWVKGRCAQCRYLDLCGGNFRVRAEAVTGDAWAPDPACYLTDEEIGLSQRVPQGGGVRP